MRQLAYLVIVVIRNIDPDQIKQGSHLRDHATNSPLPFCRYPAPADGWLWVCSLLRHKCSSRSSATPILLFPGGTQRAVSLWLLKRVNHEISCRGLFAMCFECTRNIDSDGLLNMNIFSCRCCLGTMTWGQQNTVSMRLRYIPTTHAECSHTIHVRLELSVKELHICNSLMHMPTKERWLAGPGLIHRMS